MFSITITIIIITCIVSYTAFNNEKVQSDMLFWPSEIQSRKQYYRFFSYGLIHADFTHLILNMLTLYSLGTRVEIYSFSQYYTFADKAKIFYLVLYVSAIVISTIPDYFSNRNNPSYRALGASGAVSAILFAGIALEPTVKLLVFFIPMPGYVFGILFLAVSAYLAKKGNDNIGHGAHFTGAIYGLIFTIVAAKIYSGYDVMIAFINTVFDR